MIGEESVLDTLKEIVAGVPVEYAYQYPKYITYDDGTTMTTDTCMYTTPQGKPSCIVGHVISRDFPEVLEVIHEEEWEDSPQPVSTGVPTLGRWVDLDSMYTQKAQQILADVQGLQDGGVPWHEAVARTIGMKKKEFVDNGTN